MNGLGRAVQPLVQMQMKIEWNLPLARSPKELKSIPIGVDEESFLVRTLLK